VYRTRRWASLHPRGSVPNRLRRVWLQDDAIDNGFKGVILALLQAHTLFDLGNLAVDANAITLLIERLDLLAKLAFAAADDRSHDGDPLSRRVRPVALDDLRDNLLSGLP